MISQREIPTIYGNYDYAIAREEDDCGCVRHPARPRARAALGRVDVAHTSQAAKDFMRGLPFDLRFPVGHVAVHLVHGSPRKVNEYLFEDKPARLYERLAAAERDPSSSSATPTNPGWVAYGEVLFVNRGSVGKPKDSDPRGAFAVLEAAPIA